MPKNRNLFQGWSSLELGLLGVVVILCVGAGALALFLGGAFFFEAEKEEANVMSRPPAKIYPIQIRP